MKKTLNLVLVVIVMVFSIPNLSAQLPKFKKPKIKKPKIKTPDILKKKKSDSETKEIGTTEETPAVKETSSAKEPEIVGNLKYGDTSYLRKMQDKEIWDARTYNYPEKLKACYDYVEKAKTDGKPGIERALEYLEPYKAKMHEAPRDNIYIVGGFKALKNIQDLCKQELKVAKEYILEKNREPDWAIFDARLTKYSSEIDALEKELPTKLETYRLGDFMNVATEMVTEVRAEVKSYQGEKGGVDLLVEDKKAEVLAANKANLDKIYQKQANDPQNHPDKVGKIVFSKTKDINTASSTFKIKDEIHATAFLQESPANTLREMYQAAANKDDYEFIDFDSEYAGVVNGQQKMAYEIKEIYARPIYKIYVNGVEVGVATGKDRNHYDKDHDKFETYLSGVEIHNKLCTENAKFTKIYNSDGKYRYLGQSIVGILHNAAFKAGVGNHTVKIEFYVSPVRPETVGITSKLLAEGSFQYDISTAEYNEFRKQNISTISHKGDLHSATTVAEVKRLYAERNLLGTIQKVHVLSHSYSQEFIGDQSLLERKWYDAHIIVSLNGKCALFKVQIKSVEEELHKFGKPKLYTYGTDNIKTEYFDYFSYMIDCN